MEVFIKIIPKLPLSTVYLKVPGAFEFLFDLELRDVMFLSYVGIVFQVLAA